MGKSRDRSMWGKGVKKQYSSSGQLSTMITVSPHFSGRPLIAPCDTHLHIADKSVYPRLSERLPDSSVRGSLAERVQVAPYGPAEDDRILQSKGVGSHHRSDERSASPSRYVSS